MAVLDSTRLPFFHGQGLANILSDYPFTIAWCKGPPSHLIMCPVPRTVRSSHIQSLGDVEQGPPVKSVAQGQTPTKLVHEINP